MIDVVHVTQHYGVRPVLKDINLKIGEGALVCVLGPNGMGKTTLLSVLAGILHPQKGHVEINGHRRRGSVEEELAIRRQVVFVPDHPWLPRNRTGREFLLGVGRLYDIADDRLMSHADRLLKVFELESEGDWPIHSYSNGQKHKIALCAALITDAPILILDEPFSGGLDPSGILALRHILKRLTRERNATVIMSTPVPELIEEMADVIVILREGELLAAASIDELRRQMHCSGPLSEVLQRLMHPETLKNLETYFE